MLRLLLVTIALLLAHMSSGQSVDNSISQLEQAATERQFIAAFDSMIHYLHSGKLGFQGDDVRAIIDIARQKPFGDQLLPKVYGWACSMFANGRLDQGLAFFLESAEFYKSRGKRIGEAQSYFEIALIHHRAANYEDARDYYERTLKTGGDSIHYRTRINCFNGDALIFRQREQYPQAASTFRQAYQVARNHADTVWLAILSGNIGSCHRATGSYDSSLYYYHRNLSLIRNTIEFENEIETYVNLGSVYVKKGLLAHGKAYVDSAMGIVQDRKIMFNDFFNPMDDVHKTYAEFYAAAGDYRQAYQHQVKFHEAAQKKQKAVNGRNLKQLESMYKFERHQSELGLLSDINSANVVVINQQKYIGWSLAFITALLMAVTFIVFKNARERKRLNGELVKSNAELERLNSVKDLLLSVISHDLRTPIRNLRAMLPLLQAGDLSAERSSAIYKALDDQLTLSGNTLENLLQWGKAQLMSSAMKPADVMVAPLVAQVVDQLAMDIRRKNIGVTNRLDESFSCWVDRDQLEVVFRNIIANAVKFTPDGGHIQIDGTIEGDLLTLSVKDSGVGMSAEQIAKLFKPDRHYQTYGTNKEKGTGIGLILTREMVVLNRGNIWVESAPGKGTTVFFTVRVQ
ncbi:MAG: tetratricopeptide repeat-containing sensor histidine kinase [Chryseosolibacter sp.]